MVLDSGLIAAIFGLVGALIGGFSAFFAQRWYFNQSLKKEVIEQVYSPLLYDLKYNIEYNVYNLFPAISSEEDKLRQNPKYRYIPEELREKLFTFYETHIHNYTINVQACERLINEIIDKEIIRPYRDKGLIITESSIKDRYFVNTILRFNLDGSYLGDLPPTIPTVEYRFEHYDDMGTAALPDIQTLVKDIAEKIKDNNLVKFVKEQQPELLRKVKELKTEIEKEAKL